MVKNNRTTIIVRPDIRDGLKHAARKDQSYNEILEEMLVVYKQHQYDHIFFEEIKQSNLGPRDQSKAQVSASVGGAH